MPRKQKFEEPSKIISIRVPESKVSEYREVINDSIIQYYNGNIYLDTQILKKLLPKFIELEVKLENTNENEDKRILELIKECQLI